MPLTGPRGRARRRGQRAAAPADPWCCTRTGWRWRWAEAASPPASQPHTPRRRGASDGLLATNPPLDRVGMHAAQHTVRAHTWSTASCAICRSVKKTRHINQPEQTLKTSVYAVARAVAQQGRRGSGQPASPCPPSPHRPARTTYMLSTSHLTKAHSRSSSTHSRSSSSHVISGSSGHGEVPLPHIHEGVHANEHRAADRDGHTSVP